MGVGVPRGVWGGGGGGGGDVGCRFGSAGGGWRRDGREGPKVSEVSEAREVRKERRVLDGERCRGIVGW